MELMIIALIGIAVLIAALIGSCFIPDEPINEFFSSEWVLDKMFQWTVAISYFSLAVAIAALIIFPALRAIEIDPSAAIISLLIYIIMRKH